MIRRRPSASALAVLAAARATAQPSGGFPSQPMRLVAPATAEAGILRVRAGNWHGTVVPSRPPEPALAALREATVRALRDPEEFATSIRAEAARRGEVARRSGATMD